MKMLMTVAELKKQLRKYNGDSIVAIGLDGIDILTKSYSPCGRIRAEEETDE